MKIEKRGSKSGKVLHIAPSGENPQYGAWMAYVRLPQPGSARGVLGSTPKEARRNFGRLLGNVAPRGFRG